MGILTLAQVGYSAGRLPATINPEGNLAMSLLRPLLLAVLLTLTACGPTVRHVLVPPTSMEGRRCVAQCQNTRQQCEQYNQMAYASCQNNYHLAMHNYRQCVDAGGGKRCWQPQSCWQQDHGRCEGHYRECFELCGGRIDRIVEQ